MSGYSLLLTRSWRCSDGNACLIAQRSVAFSPHWIKPRSRHYARCFSKTCWLGLLRRRRKQEGYGTGKEGIGWCSMLMARGKPPVNAPYPAHLISQQPNADWTRSALLDISDASGVKPSGPGRQCFRLTRINGLARSLGYLGQATAITEENCGRPCRRPANMSKRNRFPSANPAC